MRLPPAILGLLLLLFGWPGVPVVAQQRPAFSDTGAVHYRLPGADCALFPAGAVLPPEQQDHTPRTGRFTPTRRQVRAVETALRYLSLDRVNTRPQDPYYAAYPAHIQQQLIQYQRQYFGFLNPQGHRCLFVNFFLDQREEPAGHVPVWLRQAIWAHDGGTAFWSIYYDLTTRTFYDFHHGSEG